MPPVLNCSIFKYFRFGSFEVTRFNTVFFFQYHGSFVSYWISPALPGHIVYLAEGAPGRERKIKGYDLNLRDLKLREVPLGSV